LSQQSKTKFSKLCFFTPHTSKLYSHPFSKLQILTLIIRLCCELFGDLEEITLLLVFKCCIGCSLKRAYNFVIVGVAAPRERTCGSGHYCEDV